jgi:copper(I)-binding protein
MKMHPLETGLVIEPGKTVKLAPGGYHVMLMDLKSPLKQGDKLPVTLEFERAGKVMVSFDVGGGRRARASRRVRHGRKNGYEEDARSPGDENVASLCQTKRLRPEKQIYGY